MFIKIHIRLPLDSNTTITKDFVYKRVDGGVTDYTSVHRRFHYSRNHSL